MPANVTYVGGGNLSVAIDEAQIASIAATLHGIADPETVLRPAINETATHVRTGLVKVIKEDLNLSPTDIRDRISIPRRANAEEMQAVVHIDYRAVPLVDFSARFRQKSGGGVRVTTVRPEGAKVFKHMFAATMQSGHLGIFENRLDAKHVAKGGRYAGRLIKRGPRKGQPILRHGIQESYGPSIVSSFENAPGLADSVIEEAGEFLQRRIGSKVEAKLAGAY